MHAKASHWPSRALPQGEAESQEQRLPGEVLRGVRWLLQHMKRGKEVRQRMGRIRQPPAGQRLATQYEAELVVHEGRWPPVGGCPDHCQRERRHGHEQRVVAGKTVAQDRRRRGRSHHHWYEVTKTC